MTTGDYWFTHVYKSQTAERIGAAEQERLAGEARSVYRQQQLAARLRRHEVKLTASKPADIVEVASWASSPTEVIEWLGEDLNWPPTADPMAALLAKQRSGQCSAWSARASDRLVGFGALHVRHGGKVAELSHLLVKRHRHAVAIAVEVVRQLAAHAFADPQMEVLRLQVYAHDTLRNRAYEQAGFRAAILHSRAARVGTDTWDSMEMFLERPSAQRLL
jgi:RimJ/RimL family protein N-acetyltransferase